MLEQLWNAGFTVAAHLLNKCWRDSMGVLPDDEQAELWFRRAAEAGHDFSQYALGKLLQSQKRMDEAVSRYEKAAAQNSSDAQSSLGTIYYNGEGVTKDYAKAMEWYRKAADQGNMYGEFNIGLLYEFGYGVTKNLDEAASGRFINEIIIINKRMISDEQKGDCLECQRELLRKMKLQRV